MPLHPHHPFRHLAGALAVLLAVLGLALPGAAQTFTVIHSFDRGLEGRFYESPLILGSDGRLYGTTSLGGKYDHGTIFALAVDGTGFTVLKHFRGTAADGRGPRGGLVQGQDGRLYGTTSQPISGSQYGTIFSLNSDGSDFRVIRILTNLSEGAGLLGGLVQDAAGRLYGVASNGGGGANIGTVYSLRPDGSDFKVHQHLSNALGTAPRGRLCFGPDGRLYGTTSAGGNFGAGTIFALDPTAAPETGFTVLRHLNAATDGGTPYAGLIYGSDGRFYGVNRTGGANNSGTLFTLSVAPGGGVTYTVLQTFANAQPGSTGIWPSSELIQGLDGHLYGTTQFQSGSRVFAFDLVTNQFTNLRVLTENEGQNLMGLIQAPNGRLFGTAAGFGVFDQGSIFSLDPSGLNFTVLHQGNSQPRGVNPRGPVCDGPDGQLLGTTYSAAGTTAGRIYHMDRNGSNFEAAWESNPIGNNYFGVPGFYVSGLTLAQDGNYYGVAERPGAGGVLFVHKPGTHIGFVHEFSYSMSQHGGFPAGEVWDGNDGWIYGLTSQNGPGNGGTFYAVNLNPTFPHTKPYLETRYGFQWNGASGHRPLGRIMRGADGRFYGTTSAGGANGHGTIFAVNADGTGFTVLHAFSATGDGGSPEVGVTQAPNGRLFGATERIDSNNPGSLYSINPDGTGYRVHRAFNAAYSLSSELVIGPDGRVYGAEHDAAFSTLFSVNTEGGDYIEVRTLSQTEGRGWVNLSVLSDGLIYGTAENGGEYGGGTVFSLAVVPAPVIGSPLTAQGTYGQPFSYTIAATNSPTDFDALNLPLALVVNHATGAITGTPQVTGQFAVDIAASNAGGTGLASLSLTIAKAPAGIAFSNLAHTFDGTPKHPTITTTPAGLPLLTTYNGSLSAPTNAGSYLVESSVVDPNYTGSGSATLTISPVPTPTPTPLPVPVDITSSVTWVQGGFRLNRASRRYAQVVTLQNPNADRSGPVSFVLDGLPAGVTLTPNSGLTASVSPAGSPYVNLSLDDGVLNHLESVSFTLEFTNPANQPIAYQVRVLAGPGNR